ncbi:MAG: CRISPR-associated endonuclease Cas2 [Desulfatiglandales bacterium]
MQRQHYVVAYDISNTKRRTGVARVLQAHGERVNLSVFECELDKDGFEKIRGEIRQLINRKEDLVIYYPLCLNCLSAARSDGRDLERRHDKSLLSV